MTSHSFGSLLAQFQIPSNTANAMTDNNLSGTLVMINISGTTLTDEEREFIQDHGIRAICLFRKNLGSEVQICALTEDLRQLMGPLCLIAIDQEGGSVVRATTLPAPPSALSLAMGGDIERAQHVGAAVARGIASLGFNWNFAPVLDVNNNPQNPVIAERSFGATPKVVIDYAGAWMQGSLDENVAACIKHFPGHGDTAIDSHFDLPTIDKTLDELTRLELSPFYALRDAAPAIMTAHIMYPQWDAVYPATLSRKILHILLREQWSYQGVVITDSLSMQAINDRYGHGAAAVLALQAGADMVMALGTLDEQKNTLIAIDQSLQKKELSKQQLNTAKTRVDTLAHRFPAHARHYSPAQRDADDTLMARTWQAGLRTMHGPRAPLPGETLHILVQENVSSNGVSESGATLDSITALFEGFKVVWHLCKDLQALDAASITAKVGVRDQDTKVILVSNYRKRYGTGAHDWPIDLHLILWNPFIVLDLPVPSLISFGFGRGALAAVRRWLKGELEVKDTWAARTINSDGR